MRCTRLAANTGRKKSPSRHHRTTLSRYIFATKECIDHRKKLVKQPDLPHMSSQYGELSCSLTVEICSGVWGTPANFNGFCVLVALLHGTLVVGVSHTLRGWTERATYIRQGRHHVGIGPHSSLCLFCVVVHFFWSMNACFCCVRFSFSIPSQGALETSLKWPILCRVGCKTLSQSINANILL